MSADCWGQHWDDPVVAVPDLDGQTMPYHPSIPEAVKRANLPTDQGLVINLESKNYMDPWNNWCACGHLMVDHHFKARLEVDPALYCWAVDCGCSFIMGGTRQN